ncbi:MAG: sigma-70 family RNA polymerase sigma factor [Minicystis sp.]
MDARQLAAEHGRYLWGLCYRLTGSAADADDLLQETWLRAIERPPARAANPIRPWLVRVALNLGRDLLRARKRRGYVGPWLPSPIEIDEEPELAAEARGAEARYDLVESVSFAFLLALEALTPNQRAVLLLCDVFDYSVREAADALGISEGNVKVTHHRARRALDAYDRGRLRRTPELLARTGEALQRFLGAAALGDGAALAATLAAEARQLSDGGGEFFAARVPVVGRAKVAQLFIGLRKQGPAADRYELRMINGLPALVAERATHGSLAPRYILQCEIGPDGLIREVYTVLATRKLTALRPIV